MAGYALEDSWERARRRLSLLEQHLDPITKRRIAMLGLRESARRLEIGAGGGSIAAWLGEQVGLRGQSATIDPRPRRQLDRMKRRDFIIILGGAALLLPDAARAQEPGRIYRLGCLFVNPRDASNFVVLFDELRRLGFVEGQNLAVDPRGFGLPIEQFSEVAAELVKARVDVILVGGDVGIRTVQQATATIPILGFTDDMVGSGLVSSMARPGGNTTGISLLATELDGKRLEILIEIVPGARRIAALADANTTAPRELQALQEAAQGRGIELSIHRIAKPEEISGAMDASQAVGAQGFNVLASPLLFARRRFILERTAAMGLPAIYQWPETAEEGGLAGYGPRIIQLYRDVFARQLVKLLQGVKPAELPVEQPTTFELVINLKTAKALGLTIPTPVLARADEVIE